MNAVEKHPQRQHIIDQIMLGKPCRVVAAALDPPVHHTTLARFRVKILGTVAKKMRGGSETNHEINTMAESHGVGPSGASGPSLLQERLREELQQRALSLEERRERWISDAENRPVLDKLGNPVLDSDGSIVRMLEHKALASHDRNYLSSIELRAKLAGLLQEQAATTLNVAATFVLPGAQREQLPVGQIIDIEATR